MIDRIRIKVMRIRNPVIKETGTCFNTPAPLPGSAPDQEQDEGGAEGCGAAPRGPGGDCGGQALVQARRHKEDQRSSQG